MKLKKTIILFTLTARHLKAGWGRFVAAALVVAATWGVAADETRVMASIAPLHSLLAGVAGEEDAALLVPPGESPHDAHLRPSQARVMQHAKVIFYVGESVETFLHRAFQSLPQSVRVVAVAKEFELLPIRSGYADHDDHDGDADHDDHDDHADHDEDDDHDSHDDSADHDEDSDHDGHKHGTHDEHVWLDVQNARRIIQIFAREMSAAFPENAERYARNAEQMDAKLEALDAEIAVMLQNAGGVPFAVMHDAQQYFERRYGLATPVVAEGSAARVVRVRQLIRESDSACLFGAPQFPAPPALTEGLGARVAVLDPLGANLQPGESLYFELMRGMAQSYAGCLHKE